MLPTATRLIEGIRSAVAPLKDPARSPEDQRRAVAIEFALNELLLREDSGFLDGLLADGRALAGDVAAVTGGAPAADDLDGLMAFFTDAVGPLCRQGNARPLLERITDWENALHKRRLQPPAAPPAGAGELTVTAPLLEDYLSRHFLARPVTVSGLRQLPGGFSKLTAIFEVEGEGAFVLRGEQPLNLLLLEGTDIRNEYHILRFAERMGLPVAAPLWLEGDASRLGTRFLISAKAPGRNFGSRIDVSETISPDLLRDVMRHLVAIHTTPVAAGDPDIAASHLAAWTRYATLTDAVAAQIAFWRERSRDFGLAPSPILARAFDWLAVNVPVNDAAPALLHGDYGLHNVLIGDDGKVACILDWEATSLGDPADEMAWLSAGLAASFPREDVVALYHELGGPHLSEERLRYFEVMNAVRFEVTCGRALHLFENNPSVGLDALQLGLLYMFHGTGTLNADIVRAEAAQRTARALEGVG